MNLIERNMHRFNHVIFSNKVYNFLFKPFSRVLFETISTDKLKDQRKNSIPLNKICQVADIYHPHWKRTSSELKLEMNEENFHRKDWEYTQIIYSLKKLHFLTPQSVCLGIGAGRENLLYYLTYKVKKVIGIDLYEGNYYGGEDEEDIPLSVERYAPFPYIKEKLNLIRMNALNLEFPNNFFDFIFSASSIEHFGEKKDILQALKEMYRVLKPGGAAVITTELKLTSLSSSPPNVRPFFLRELLDLIHTSGFNTFKEFDLRIEDEYLRNCIKLPEEINKRPHVILRFLSTVFTSVNIVLQKQGDEAFIGTEIFPTIGDFDYQGEIEVRVLNNLIYSGGKLDLFIRLKNTSNFKWINSGVSHRIALGIHLFSPQNQLEDRDFCTIVIPREVDAGETIEFETSIIAPKNKGKWILRFDLKKELVFWFSEKGNPFTDVVIDVI
jgi:SAM-dependent methyltransferase